MRRVPFVLSACAAFLLAGKSIAQAPAPIDPMREAFPGSLVAPGSAASAALALSDRWLGDEPFANPAAPRGFVVMVSPLFQRMSRQDLRSDNRSFEESAGFIDLAGSWVGVPLGPVQLSAYAYQPVLRHENNSYLLGRGFGSGPAGALASEATAREIRAGLSVAFRLGRARIGVAGERNHRSDFYDLIEVSGSPDQGHRRANFRGSGFGAQAGGNIAMGPRKHLIEWGGAVRLLPEIALEGTEVRELLSDTSAAALTARRGSSWEAGLSARMVVSETFRLVAGVGRRGAQDWGPLGVTAGAGAEWKLGGEYREPSLPWTVRFGLGIEQQKGVPESRAGVFGLGLGWAFQRAQLDFGLLHRALSRAGQPTSYDDRLVASLAVR